MLPSEDYIKSKKTNYLKSKNKRTSIISFRDNTKSQVKVYLTPYQRKLLRRLADRLNLSQSELVGWMIESFIDKSKPSKSTGLEIIADRFLNILEGKQNVYNKQTP